MKDRTELITEIAQYRADISTAIEDIKRYPWDSERDLYILTKTDISRILERYLSDEITTDNLLLWANFIEGRDDVGYEPGPEEIIDEVIFLLANPEINYPITKTLVTELKNSLSKGKT